MMLKAEVHKLIHSSVTLALTAGAPGLSETSRNAIAISAAVRAADPIAKAIQAEHDRAERYRKAHHELEVRTVKTTDA